MIGLKRAALVVLFICSSMSIAIGEPHAGVKPKNGFVPDQATATRVAEAVLIPIYGRQKVESERPFSAQLDRNTWKVTGYLAPEFDGGVAEVWIDKRDGRILHVTHGK